MLSVYSSDQNVAFNPPLVAYVLALMSSSGQNPVKECLMTSEAGSQRITELPPWKLSGKAMLDSPPGKTRVPKEPICVCPLTGHTS